MTPDIGTLLGIVGAVATPFAMYSYWAGNSRKRFEKRVTEAVEGQQLKTAVTELQTVTKEIKVTNDQLAGFPIKFDQHVKDDLRYQRAHNKRLDSIEGAIKSLHVEVTKNNAVAVQAVVHQRDSSS